MSKWITGRQLIELLKIRDFEILEIIRKGARPYDELRRDTVGRSIEALLFNWGIEWTEQIAKVREEEEKEDFSFMRPEFKKVGSIRKALHYGEWCTIDFPADSDLGKKMKTMLIDSFYRVSDLERIGLMRSQAATLESESEQLDAGVSRAKDWLPVVESLYKLTMQWHRPLEKHAPENCLKTALDILDYDPQTYSPISKEDLSTDLFTRDRPNARRDFVGKLLQRLLMKEGHTVSNYQTLYKKVKARR